MSISDITILVIVSTTSVGGCIGFIMYHIRRSRCQYVECCCVRCSRDIMSGEEMKADKFTPMQAPTLPIMHKNTTNLNKQEVDINDNSETRLYDINLNDNEENTPRYTNVDKKGGCVVS